MRIKFPPASSRPKAEIEIVPQQSLVRAALAEADLKILFTRSNRVRVHDVFAEPFSEDVAPEIQEKLASNLMHSVKSRWQETPRFSVVTSRLSCMPSPDCKFTWLRVGFDLGDERLAAFRPIACKLYPESQQDVVNVNASIEISGQLKIRVAQTDVKRISGTGYEQRQYHVSTYGAFSSNPAWDFQGTDVHPEIRGDLALLMVVASRGAAERTGRIRISAKVELVSGVLIPLITRRTSEDAAAITFTI